MSGFGFKLTIFRIYRAARICNFFLSQNLESFQHHTLPPLFYDSGDMYARPFVIVSWVFETLLFNFSSISFLIVFRLYNFYCFVNKFTYSLLWHLHSAIEPTQWICLILVVFFVLKFLLRSLYFLCFYISIFSLISDSVCSYFLGHVHYSCFRVFVR